MKAESERRALQKEVADQKEQLMAGKNTVSQFWAAATASQPDTDAIRQATSAARQLEKQLAKGEPLELRDPAYYAEARVLRKDVENILRTLDLSKRWALFIDGPTRFFAKGKFHAQRFADSKDRTDRRTAVRDAAEQFQDCAHYGKTFIQRAPDLAQRRLAIENRPTAQALVAVCQKQAIVFSNILKKYDQPPSRVKRSSRLQGLCHVASVGTVQHFVTVSDYSALT